MTCPAIRWDTRPFEGLSLATLYALLRARAEVFIVEQDCAYQDLDNADHHAEHIIGWSDGVASPEILAYCRVLPPGIKFPDASIGRVITTAAGRGCGIGQALMHRAINRCEERFPGSAIRISAQLYLERFYSELGFRTVSDIYDEDGIPHIEMVRDC